MSIDIDVDLKKAQSRLEAEGLRLVRDSAAKMRDGAQSRAPVGDTGHLRSSIQAVPKDDGGDVLSGASYSSYVEYGTGKFTDPEGPGRESTKDVWTYYSEQLGRFVTARGTPKQEFMRPSFAEARQYFDREAKRRGLQ